MEGLDVIDFPGVDDRDETIPDLAELLLSLAQVVIFVVDYRLGNKAHYYMYMYCILICLIDVFILNLLNIG